jgi:hypothetical protein
MVLVPSSLIEPIYHFELVFIYIFGITLFNLSMSEIATNILDHIVHLVPPGSLEQASEQFRALGFTLSVHCDGNA